MSTLIGEKGNESSGHIIVAESTTVKTSAKQAMTRAIWPENSRQSGRYQRTSPHRPNLSEFVRGLDERWVALRSVKLAIV